MNLPPVAVRRSAMLALLPALAGAVAILLMSRSVIGHIPLYDELLHVLSARGLIEQGVPAIADGLYTRASLYTRLVAASIEAFGDTLVAARVPSLVAAALLVALTGGWLARRAGLVAGLGAALALCLAPETVQLAVFVRFYPLHALLVLLAFAFVYGALDPGAAPRRRAVLLLLSLLLLPIAWHLQPSTAIAAGGVGLAGAAVLAMDHWPLVRGVLVRRPLACVAAAVVLAALAAVVLVKLGFVEALREAPVWASGVADRKHYYLIQFTRTMPLLWPLLPVAVVAAFRVDRRLAMYCIVLFGVAFVVHSLAAAKQPRYIYYAMPAACMLWGLGLSAAVRAMRGRWFRPAAIAAMGVALVFSVEGQRMAKLLAGRIPMVEALPYTVEPDWEPVMDALRPRAEAADRLVTSNSMKALYYLGRYDYELNASIVAETDTGEDFGTDPRTGRQAISSPAAVSRVVGGPESTLVVIEEESMNRETHVSAAALAALARYCGRIGLPAGSGMAAWECPASGG